MSEQATTPYSDKIQILAELWMDYRDDETFTQLLEYGDLGFPMSYAIAENIIESSPLAEQYINELWELLLAELGVEDTGSFVSLSDVFDASPASGLE